MIVLYIVLGLIVLAALTAFVFCLNLAYTFLHRRRVQKPCPTAYLPIKDELYAAYDALKAQGLEEHSCESAGKKLYADFLPGGTDKAVVLLHGLRGRGRDRALDAQYYIARGYSVLMPDLRGCGRSAGQNSDLGLYTREDVLVWCALLRARLGADCRIVLDGISMGAASALMIAEDGNCPGLAAVIADAPFSSVRDMSRAILEQKKLPGWLFAFLYPVERLCVRLLIGRDPKKAAPEAFIDRLQTPVLFLHGEADAFVPCDMSRRMFAACPAEKKALFTLPEVPHVGMRVQHRAECEAQMDALLSKIM